MSIDQEYHDMRRCLGPPKPRDYTEQQKAEHVRAIARCRTEPESRKMQRLINEQIARAVRILERDPGNTIAGRGLENLRVMLELEDRAIYLREFGEDPGKVPQ